MVLPTMLGTTPMLLPAPGLSMEEDRVISWSPAEPHRWFMGHQNGFVDNRVVTSLTVVYRVTTTSLLVLVASHQGARRCCQDLPSRVLSPHLA